VNTGCRNGTVRFASHPLFDLGDIPCHGTGANLDRRWEVAELDKVVDVRAFEAALGFDMA